MRAGIALGSNLGDRMANLRAARELIPRLAGVSPPLSASRIYETDPVNSTPDSGAYLNAVLEVEYEGQPTALLDELQTVEAALGRPSKRPRNSPRTIDLDLLYVGNHVLTNQDAVIPHPRLAQRRFVLTPLADIRPDLILPGQQRSVAELLAALQDPAAVTIFSTTWEP